MMKSVSRIMIYASFLVVTIMVGSSSAFDCSSCLGKAADVCRRMNTLEKKLKSGAVKSVEKSKSDLENVVPSLVVDERGKGHGSCADILDSALASMKGTPVAPGGGSTKASTSARAGEVWKEPVTGMEMVWVPKGCYKMGCGWWSGECCVNEEPVHEVCVDGFWMGKYEVTQGEWVRVMGSNPSEFTKGDGYPVEKVSWEEATQFIGKLNSMKQGEYQLRLPTEAEWEYACRSGGKPEKYAGGSETGRVAWFWKNSGKSTHPVGTKEPNGLGIYDMSGNVFEWCGDVYSQTAYRDHSRNNPVYDGSGSDRSVRGGCWYSGPGGARCATRYYYGPTFHGNHLGIRVVRTP